ncbi:DUF4192 family protein [Leucobacter sp. CSA1]|uniref:DUF4192 family protein n=1 Tax=Leucobacter chromiisoli TaxID=2796471 RepID=A0A934Q6M4_9MICO|nr:DUF4192 family protein [Leucobacter chromiisoli]MBK0418393.1 DUF4192 family protein [Leucobacter chromiisoli]
MSSTDISQRPTVSQGETPRSFPRQPPHGARAPQTSASPPPHPRPRVLRCEGTADFIAALPQIAGFTAPGSLFLVLFSGKQAGTAARFDLPAGEGPRETRALLDMICSVLRSAGAESDPPALVITSEQTFREAGGAPWRRLAERLERRLRREGVRLRELCCVAPDGWASYLDPAAPPGGRPLSDIEQSPIAREAAARGETVPDLAALAEIAVAPPERLAAVRAALDALSSPGLPEPGVAPPSASGSGLDAPHLARAVEIAALIDELLQTEPGEADAVVIARTVRSAEHPGEWLLLVLSVLTRAAFVAELMRDSGLARFIDLPVDSDSGGSMRRLLASLTAEAPDRERLRAATEAVRGIVGSVPEERRPPLLTLLAWMWWMRGLQSVACRHIGTALGIAPGHPLALMVRRLVEIPVTPPGWSAP